MKFNTLIKTKKKVKSITGVLFLTFLGSGCVGQANQTGGIQTCKQADAAVEVAQQQYDNAIQKLATGEITPNTTPSVSIIQNLQEAEETAFEICNKFS
ncbi:MAG: hypothetical protein LDL41_26255 [Coleofasciculus sp. S288]|nr:hypothetical protein [Coleofasciculus sp. S288]